VFTTELGTPVEPRNILRTIEIAKVPLGEPEQAAQVNRWLQIAQINALLAIAEALEDRREQAPR
jgi:hypothetical protein